MARYKQKSENFDEGQISPEPFFIPTYECHSFLFDLTYVRQVNIKSDTKVKLKRRGLQYIPTSFIERSLTRRYGVSRNRMDAQK